MHSFIFLYLLGISVLLSPAAAAKNYRCPETIATFANNKLADKVGSILSHLYQELGCSIRLIPLPNKRSIARFNKQAIDGEIFRHDAVEKYYTTNFVRSSKPLFILRSSIFKNTNKLIEKERPLGYVRGIIWQEEYKTDKNRIAFSSNQEMLNAFERGAIGSFMANNLSFKKLIASRKITSKNIIGKTVYSAPLYHYLQADYTGFMHALSARIEQKAPFKDF